MVTIYDIDRLNALAESRGIALEALLHAIKVYINSIGTPRETDRFEDLKTIYLQVSSSSTMTGTTEQ